MENMKSIREINIETKSNIYAKHEAAIPQPKPLTDKQLEVDNAIREGLENPITPKEDNRLKKYDCKRGFLLEDNHTLLAETNYINTLKPFTYDEATDVITTSDRVISGAELFCEIQLFGIPIEKIYLLRKKLKAS
mgnify:CR=1 FL=1